MIHTMEILIENVRPYELWSYIEDLKKCKSYCFQTEYKGISIKYYITSSTLILVVDVLDILQKDKVCVSDLAEFKIKMEQIVYELIGRKAILKVNRVDYFVDLYFVEDELEIIKNELLNKHFYTYSYMRVRRYIRLFSCVTNSLWNEKHISVFEGN